MMSSAHKMFTADEKALLIQLVRSNSVVQQKGCDVISMARKRKAWEGIASAYNSKPHVTKRTVHQLKKCWINMKARHKKELTGEITANLRIANGGEANNDSSFRLIPESATAASLLPNQTGFRFILSDSADTLEGDMSEDATFGGSSPPPPAPNEEPLFEEGEEENGAKAPKDKRVPEEAPFVRRSAVDVRRLYELKLEEQSLLVEAARVRLRSLEVEERRREEAFAEEERRRQAAFEADERRKEQLHAIKMSVLKMSL
ncbi:myb/SANT-like DNA-binding domain-containing protein 3 [Ischnura elegans]|uniref:myb/SANT-like DNA-binding domain-containing protein 3 n=1 Tax=Ischnura elegans TaxID=197161 RepID=UPI001ED89625|nr:myb/SANT-like DNA-binding domain-containing protein 3 [Ischnura elegans]